MHKITPYIRCTDNAQQVAEYYTTIFPDAKIHEVNPIVTGFEIFGQSMGTINGGENPDGKVNPSISFSLWINDKELTKQIRDKLMDGWKVLMEYAAYPRSEAYGRCSDKYGVSRQVMYSDTTPENKLIPSMMFIGENTGKAQEAMNFYTSLFPASKIGNIHRYGPDAPDKAEHIAHAEFTLVNQLFIAMDSWLDHKFNFNDGISLSVSCKDQTEVDYYRNAFTADGGSEVQCGWCKDKYGVSRQIVPVDIDKLLFNADHVKANKAMQAMLQMKKLDIAKIEEAFNKA